MPGEIVLKCAECGATTCYPEVKYTAAGMQINHKLDCGSQYLACPKVYLTQAINPLGE
jgi:hypothetical protein